MRANVVVDSGFLVATIVKTDVFHNDAIFLFEEFKAREGSIQLFIPPLVIYEVIVVLRRKGLSADDAQKILLRFVRLPYVSILAMSELSAFKHAAHSLNNTDQSKALRTHDFLIFCIAEELGATVVTFDYTMRTKCRQVYDAVYYPSAQGGHSDETVDILTQIDSAIGVETGADDYEPLQTVGF